jgi:hypothetical protein
MNLVGSTGREPLAQLEVKLRLIDRTGATGLGDDLPRRT